MSGRDIYLYVYEGMADWQIAYVTAGIGETRLQRRPGHFDLRTVAVRSSSNAITTIGGLRVVPDLIVEAVFPETAAMLILPGGGGWEEGTNTRAAALAGRLIKAGVPIGVIGEATLGVARIGLLDNTRHTSNSKAYIARTGYQGGDYYREGPTRRDAGMITASGYAPIDFAAAVFECLNLFEPTVLATWIKMHKTGDFSLLADLRAAAADARVAA